MRFSLATLLGLTAFIGACCSSLFFPDFRQGAFVVVMTNVIFVFTTIQAMKTRSWFWIGFSAAGWIWLVLTLGFYETWEPNVLLHHVATLLSEIWTAAYGLVQRTSLSGTGRLPLYANVCRVFICTSAFLIAFTAGLICHLLRGATRPTSKVSE